MDYLSYLLCLLMAWFAMHLLVSTATKRKHSKQTRLPPGPNPLPVLGNLLSLGTKPHASLAELAKTHSPLMLLQLGWIPTIVISSAAVAKEALQNNDLHFSNRMIMDAVRALDHHQNSLAFLPVGPKWRSFRKICNSQVFSISRLEASQRLHGHKDLFIAGTDTTSSTLEWAMAELLHNPDKMKKAQAELEEVIGKGNPVEEPEIPRLPYLQDVVKETLRLHPPVPFLVPRQADSEVSLCGFTVPKHAQVLVNVWAIGRDPDIWRNPNSFHPERFMGTECDVKGRDFKLIPFGAGRRICPGLPLATRMIPLMLGSLIHEFD